MELLEEGKPVEGGAIQGLLAQVVEEYAPETDAFDVTIMLGGEPTRIPFRRPRDGKEMEDLQAEAVKYAQTFRPVKSGKMRVRPMSPEMRKWGEGVKPEVFAKVYFVTRLALDPSFQAEAAVMQLYRRAWPVFNTIVAQIDLAVTNRTIDAENEDYLAEGKGSATTEPTG